MPGQPVRIGPFTGGLNTYSDPTAVGDNEATELINFDVDIDGSLVTRPPICKLEDTPTNKTSKILGWFTWTNGDNYLIISEIDPTGTTTTRAYNVATDTWVLITGTFAATAMVQYQNKAWLVADPTETDPGGTWDPSAGFTATAGIKKGRSAVVYKERLWVGEGGTGATASRVYFSDAATFGTFGGTSFFDAKAGDGQSIVDMIVYADTIIIFKENSTYFWAYDSKPANGKVSPVSNVIGIAGKDCVFEYETNLYVFHNKNIYSITNWNYTKLNIKLPLKYSNSRPSDLMQPFSMSQINDRLVLRYYDLYFVFGLKTRAWSQWQSTLPPVGKFWYVPQPSTSVTVSQFVAAGVWRSASGVANCSSLYDFKDDWETLRSETMDWSIVTKSYDFQSPYTFKKLYWWGVDAESQSSMLGQVFPIFYGHSITWSEARSYTWTQARAFTWARFGVQAVNVDTQTTVKGSSNRVFVKMMKALRYRQVAFKISGTLDGTSASSPMRIFGMTAFVDTKEKVVSQVT